MYCWSIFVYSKIKVKASSHVGMLSRVQASHVFN